MIDKAYRLSVSPAELLNRLIHGDITMVDFNRTLDTFSDEDMIQLASLVRQHANWQRRGLSMFIAPVTETHFLQLTRRLARAQN